MKQSSGVKNAKMLLFFFLDALLASEALWSRILPTDYAETLSEKIGV